MRHQKGKPPEFLAVEKEVEGIIDDLELYSYYQLLELRPDSSAAMVDYNFNIKTVELKRLQKNIHCGAVMLQSLNTLIERMDEAYQVLSDPDRRHEYNVGLELGQLRHLTVVEQRAIPMPKRVDRDQYLEKVTAGLEKKLGQEMLHSGEDEGDELAPIDGDYLDEAISELGDKLKMDALELHDPGEQDDVSADKDFAGVMLEDIEADLEELGLSKEELGLQDDEARHEQIEMRRLKEELAQSTSQAVPGVTPLLQSLSAPPPSAASPARIRHELSADPAPEQPAAPFASGGVIELEEDDQEEGLPLRDEEGERPFEDVIQLDDEDL